MNKEETAARPGLLARLAGNRYLLLALAALAGVLLLCFSGNAGATEPAPAALAPEVYRAQLESDLTALCARVDGAGALTLCVTLAGGERAVYAADRTSSGATDYVTRAGEGLLIGKEYPAVIGVGVVCEGGNDPRVAAALTALLSATLGIGSNRIAVCAGHP